MMHRGRCLCGQVSYLFKEPVNWVGHCHCQSCRLNTASPFTTFVGVPLGSFQYTGMQPHAYASSPGVKRWFCAKCGTPIAFQSQAFTGEIHIYLASLENPNAFSPRFHVHYGEKLAFIHDFDALPKHQKAYGEK